MQIKALVLCEAAVRCESDSWCPVELFPSHLTQQGNFPFMISPHENSHQILAIHFSHRNRFHEMDCNGLQAIEFNRIFLSNLTVG